MSNTDNFPPGPNTTTGHTSFLMAVENAVNYSLRVIEPVLKGKGSVVEVKREAEEKYVQWVHSSLQNTVFSTGCTSWYNRAVDGKKPWNATVYPLSQAHYWYSCVFPSWKDWRFSVSLGSAFVFMTLPIHPTRGSIVSWPCELTKCV